MRAHIVHPDPSSEFYTPERCFILESWNTPEDEGLSIARARVQPGVTTALHALRATVERYLILSGSGIVEVDTLPPTTVTAGDKKCHSKHGRRCDDLKRTVRDAARQMK